MKRIVLLLAGICMSHFLFAQTLSERIALKACECLESVENMSQLEDSVLNCSSGAMTEVIMGSSPEEKKILGNVHRIRGLAKEVQELLPSVCPNVRRIVLEEKEKAFYQLSENEQANEYFDQGNELMEAGEYKKAARKFKKAIRKDEQFVYAIDHLAVCYRKREKFKRALKYYNQSLEIFPEGKLALLNMAVIYSLTNELDQSLNFYEDLRFYYPDYSEGYFGAGKILFIKGDYESSLDNLFMAHRIYAEENSAYLQDSQQLIELVFARLQELGKLDLIEKKAKEYGIEIQLESGDQKN